MEESEKGKVSFLLKIFIGIMAFLFLPILASVGLIYALWGLVLSIAIWGTWGIRGKYILFVYSNSPIWKDVIENEVIPAIVDKTIVLNWSERTTWQPSLAVCAFHYFGGRRNFNPLAIVFRPFKLNQTFRFYEAFQDYKHGKKEKFEKLRTGLLHFVR